MPIFLPRKPDTQPLVVCFCHPVCATERHCVRERGIQQEQ